MEDHGGPWWSSYGAAAHDGPRTRTVRHYLNGEPCLEQRKAVRKEEQHRGTLSV